MYKITWMIMKLIPLGIFGLLAPIIGEYGLSVLLPLIKLVSVVAAACIVHAIIIYSIGVKTLGNMSPWRFFKRSEEHTSELQSRGHLVCRLLLEKKKRTTSWQ